MYNPKQHGFTIVELLIVIVIIAVLAAITIVAFNGIQQRAENTKTIQAVNTYAKALQSYKAINSSYPGVGVFTCITGAASVCGNVTDTASTCFSLGRYSGGSSLDAALAGIINSLPQPSAVYGQCSGKNYGGIFYDNNRLIWFLKGSQTCETPGGMSGVDTLVSGDVTRCFANLP